MSMTEKEIVDGFCDMVLREQTCNRVFPNVFINKWECDILKLTKSGYSSEYEVKISRADFKADVKKKGCVRINGLSSTCAKHDIIAAGNRTNYFYYLVPKGLITPEEVPEYAGLIYAEKHTARFFSHEKNGYYKVDRIFFSEVKPAMKLSRVKMSDEMISSLYNSVYYRFHSLREKQSKSKSHERI